jgi:hypothetical protein
VSAPKFLPPRTVEVLLDVDGAPKWVRANYRKTLLGHEWLTDGGSVIEPSEVVDFREVP